MSRQSEFDWPAIVLVFCAAMAMFVYRAWTVPAGAAFFLDTDDAMRLVRVRDLMAGQDWFDWVQYRLNTPFGAELHWSRLVDLPLAALIGLFAAFGLSQPEIWAGHVWPLSLFIVLLILSGRLCWRLAGPAGVLPGVVLPLLSPAVIAEFAPGRIDHHNVQVVITLAIAWATVESLRRPGFAVLAGILAATGLAIATESLPAVGAAIIGYGLIFVWHRNSPQVLLRFGLAFAGAALAHLAIAFRPEDWFDRACDAWSGVYAGSALIVGLSFVILACLTERLRSPQRRLAAVFILGGLALAAVLALFPHCLGGPYGQLDPWLRENWLQAIAEAKPWLASLYDLPAYTLAVGIPPLLGLITMAAAARRDRRNRNEWLVLMLFTAVAFAVMLTQVRGARLATMPALPAAAWLIVVSRQAWLNKKARGGLVGLALGWVGFAGVLVVLLVNMLIAARPGRPAEILESRAQRELCLAPSAFGPLLRIEPSRLLAPIDLGAHVLLETPHAVIGAPYHRNERGVLDTFAAFNGSSDVARHLLAERGITHVAVCEAMAEMRGLPDAAPDALVRHFASGTPPDWLEPVSNEGPIALYRIITR